MNIIVIHNNNNYVITKAYKNFNLYHFSNTLNYNKLRFLQITTCNFIFKKFKTIFLMYFNVFRVYFHKLFKDKFKFLN